MRQTSSCGCGGSSAKCKCGCECQPDCCRLDCLERPNFFCGQLLTDQDFNKLVEWVDRKQQLQRYLQGWGVVCGLDVTLDPCDCTNLIVSPGYGIDCCGRDLVVCEPQSFSLKKLYCEEKKSPCDDVRRRIPIAAAPTPAGPPLDLPGLSFPESEFTKIDVFLRYGEELSRPQRQVTSGTCSSSSSVCQFTRVTQVGEICTKLVNTVAPTSPTTYLDRLGKLAKQLGQITDMEQLKRYLEGDHRRDYGGLHRFTFIPHLKDVTQAWHWIVQDWFLSQAVSCPDCDETTGIPIARVYLRKWENQCCVFYIEMDPSARRMLTKDPSFTNRAQDLWQLKNDVTNVTSTAVTPETDLNKVIETFKAATWAVPAGVKAKAGVITFNGKQRIAFFNLP